MDLLHNSLLHCLVVDVSTEKEATVCSLFYTFDTENPIGCCTALSDIYAYRVKWTCPKFDNSFSWIGYSEYKNYNKFNISPT